MNPPEGEPRPLRVLFLTRRYPPTRGGAQTHAYKLYTYLSQRMPTKLIALQRESILHLAWFMPLTWMRAAWVLLLRRADVVYFADGVVGSLAAALVPFRGPARFCCSIFGLEMTFGNQRAQQLMRAGAMQCAGIAVISDNSRRLAVDWGLPEQRLRLIYVGVEPPAPSAQRMEQVRDAFEQQHGLHFGQDRLAVAIGRLVPRKGVADFVEHGMPRLADDIRFIIVGEGIDTERVLAARNHLANPGRVLVLGALDDDICAMLRQCCDLFFMPNVPMANDVEGYGIAPLEAMYMGTPVVAFAVDSLAEAVREGGWLVPSGDYDAFARAVHEFFELSTPQRQAAGEAARTYCLREYGWDTSAAAYAQFFREITD